nr:amylosucrase [Ktedonobacterales bacterium]
FGYNAANGDMRICGTTASLAGLEAAQRTGDAAAMELALRRIVASIGITLAAGGIPLLYLGDEVGTLNDYRYLQDVATANDARWVHRPRADAHHLAERHDPATSAGRLFSAIRRMIAVRTTHPLFAATNPTQWLDVGNDAVVALTRGIAAEVLVLVNVSAAAQTIPLPPYTCHDLLSIDLYPAGEEVVLAPYAMKWLAKEAY